MPPVFVIVNPASSAGRTAGRWCELEPQVRAQLGTDLQVAITTAPGQATELVRQALGDGPRRVISVGGDGTHHEVINGFFPPESRVPIAPEARFSFISSGTGSDLARSFESQGNLTTLLSKIASDQASPLDLIGCHYTRPDKSTAFEVCINIGSVGLGGWVTRKVDSRSKGLLPAQLLFFLTSVEGLFRTSCYDIRFRLDEEPWQHVSARNLVAANARFQGGGMEIAPDADPHDGRLDVVVSGGFRALQLVWASRLIYQGRGQEHPLITMDKARRVVVEAIDANEPLFLELDGEGVGQTPVTFEVLPARIQAIV